MTHATPHATLAELRALYTADLAAVPQMAGSFDHDYCSYSNASIQCYQISGEADQDDEPLTFALCPADDYSLEQADRHAAAICAALTAVPRDAALVLALLTDCEAALVVQHQPGRVKFDVSYTAALATLRRIATARGLVTAW